LAAKKQAPGGARNMKVFYGVLALVAVVGVAAIIFSGRGSAGMATEPIDLSGVADARALLERAQGVSVGAEGAPVQMLVFSDYMCPACAAWAGQIEPMLKAEFVATGQLHYTYYDFPLGGNFKHSFAASRAARCAADQGRFWEYHDRLLGTQQSWAYQQNTPVSHFLQVAGDVGVERRSFESCLRSDEHAELVTANRLLGQTLGVGGTPTIFINGRQLTDWRNYGDVRAAVQAAAPTPQ
jgi:protein-disulfide isomerase